MDCEINSYQDDFQRRLQRRAGLIPPHASFAFASLPRAARPAGARGAVTFLGLNDMRIHVLGPAAGGGFLNGTAAAPTARELARARRGPAAHAGARSGERRRRLWFLLNVARSACADRGLPPLHPRDQRHSPVAGIVLTNPRLDHCPASSVRESHPLVLYATDAVRRADRAQRPHRTPSVRGPVWRSRARARGRAVGKRWTAERSFAGRGTGPGKQPVHPHCDARPEENVGLRIRGAAGCSPTSSAGAIDAAVLGMLEDADCVFFDGMFCRRPRSLIRPGSKRARHGAPADGGDAHSARLAPLRDAALLHPRQQLEPDTPRGLAGCRQVVAAGWRVAEDGMELEL